MHLKPSNLCVLLLALCAAGVCAADKDKVAAAPAAAPAPKQPEISFRLDVMPVFFRAGCNAGGCHGAARGKDGFRLSLFGYDPVGDYFRLTQQIVGRRINLAMPSESLVLSKATGKVPHTGGELFKADSPYYKTLIRWIEAGAEDDDEAVPEVLDVALVPAKHVFTGKQKQQPLKVIAAYSDGTKRDVTHLSLFLTNNKTTAEINEHGVVTAGRRGATDVFARFAKFTVGAEIIVLPEKDNFVWPKEAVAVNYVDELIHSKLQKLRVIPAGLCNDEHYVRRLYMDVTGVPPTVDEYRAFMADAGKDKRTRLVDELLKRPEYADVWSAHWGEWLKLAADNNGDGGRDRKAAGLYYEWIREQFRTNAPLDQFVKTQLVARGSSFKDPESNFYTMIPAQNYDPKSVAQDVSQLFMGIRIQCAECHNHPFDRWTMDDYYGFVSFFTGLKRKKASEDREFYIYNDANGAPAKHLLDGRPMAAKPLGSKPLESKEKDQRATLAGWLVAPENKLFAQSMANRIWAHYIGRGIVEPIDDMRITNPASNRELYEELGKKLVLYKFDQKKLVRDILLSRTYQLSSAVNDTNRDDERQFSHAQVRRLRADLVLDAMSQATSVPTRFNNFPIGYRAMQLFEGGRGNYFLQTFGQSERKTVCACDDRTEATFAQTLHLINGDTLRTKVAGSKVVDQMLKDKKQPTEIIEELFIRALTRKPSEEEKKAVLELAGANANQRKVYDNLFWALMNSTEFLFAY